MQENFNPMNDIFSENAVTHDDRIAILRSKMWTPDLDKLLRRWKKQLLERRMAHADYARSQSNKHYLFGVPSVFVTAVTSSSVITVSQLCPEPMNTTGYNAKCEVSNWLLLALGGIGIFSSALVGVMTFLNFQEGSQANKTAADNYESLMNDVDSILVLPVMLRGDPATTLKNVRYQYDEIVKKAPSLPSKYEDTLSFGVISSSNNTNNSPHISIPIDVRSSQPIKKDVGEDQEILQKIMEISDSPTGSIKQNRDSIPETTVKNDLTSSDARNIVNNNNKEELQKINKILQEHNDFNSSDDEKEIQIGFDIDRVTVLDFSQLTGSTGSAYPNALSSARKFRDLDAINKLQRTGTFNNSITK